MALRRVPSQLRRQGGIPGNRGPGLGLKTVPSDRKCHGMSRLTLPFLASFCPGLFMTVPNFQLVKALLLFTQEHAAWSSLCVKQFSHKLICALGGPALGILDLGVHVGNPCLLSGPRVC